MEEVLSYQGHLEKYSAIRAEIYKQLPIALNMPGVRVTPINTEALAAYRNWPDIERIPPNGGWDWASWVSHYRSKHPKRIEVAIWFGSTLCGLLLGKASHKNIHVRLEVIEASTDNNHPLKGRVAYIGLTAVEMFGYAIGAEQSRIIDPVDGAINSYKKLGYELFPSDGKQPRYLAKTLNGV